MVKGLINKISNYVVNKNEDIYVSNILKNSSFDSINNKLGENNGKILFVIPQMRNAMGGLTSVLRIASRLSNDGFKVYFSSYNCNDLEKMHEAAMHNLSEYSPNFIKLDSARQVSFQFVIATNWQSVYFSKSIKGYKLFFVQDYEPYFYSYSDQYFLAKKSYELGFHIISLGKWNLEQIQRNCRVGNYIKADYIDFPFEPKEYIFKARDFSKYQNKKTIKIAVYVKREKKRIPSLIFSILNNTFTELLEKGIKLEIYYFGLNKNEKVKIGTNLGRLSKSKLAELYDNCDYGLVASMTNVSLVPYEMIGSGLPVIEFKDGTFEYFLGNTSAILIDFDYHSLVSRLIEYNSSAVKLMEMTTLAYNEIKDLSWDKTYAQMKKILNNVK